jgi:hypothetical protein
MAGKWCPFYNVGAAVGRNATNLAPDVMIVQFFLRELSAHPDFAGGTGRPAQPCGVDGFYGPNTQAWIDWLQCYLKSRGLSVTTDGRVDPAPNSDWSAKGSISQTKYTITHMNGSFRRRYRNRHDRLESDPAVPQTLRSKFQSDEP